MEIITKQKLEDSFKEVQKLLYDYGTVRTKTYQKYEKRFQVIFVFLWLGISFLLLLFTFIGALISFIMMFGYYMVPGVSESRRVEKFFYYFWKRRFRKEISTQKAQIVLELFELKDYVVKMGYYSEWILVSYNAKKIMGII